MDPDCASATLSDFAAPESTRKPLLHTRGISQAGSFDLEVTPWAPTRLTSCIFHSGHTEAYEPLRSTRRPARAPFRDLATPESTRKPPVCRSGISRARSFDLEVWVRTTGRLTPSTFPPAGQAASPTLGCGGYHGCATWPTKSRQFCKEGVARACKTRACDLPCAPGQNLITPPCLSCRPAELGWGPHVRRLEPQKHMDVAMYRGAKRATRPRDRSARSARSQSSFPFAPPQHFAFASATHTTSARYGQGVVSAQKIL
eukprot:COSAG04_NODE_148_length_22826_cov_11.360026_14_plen_258_part_00